MYVFSPVIARATPQYRQLELIGINSNIPAAILSNSIQIGGPTSTVFLQAADGGLDLGPSAARRS